MSAGGLLARAKLWLLRLVSAVYGPLKIGAHLLELWWMLRPCVAERRKAAEAERAFSELIRKLPELTEPWEARLSRKREKWSGRGIVVVAGGPSYGTLAVELVRSIRAYGCRLPIEVFHLGPAERECGACDELAALDGVVLRDLLSGHPTLCEAAGFGYAAKPLAVAASSFEEVLLLDADNTCCADPSHLFECAAYREAGAVFWCDMYSSAVRPGGGGGSAASGKFVRMFDPWGVRQRPTVVEATLQDVIDRLLITPVRKRPNFDEVLSSAGLPPSQLTQESGQLLLHKGRCLRGLAAVVQLNMNSQRAVVCVRRPPPHLSQPSPALPTTTLTTTLLPYRCMRGCTAIRTRSAWASPRCAATIITWTRLPTWAAMWTRRRASSTTLASCSATSGVG